MQNRALAVISTAVFLASSIWFSGTAVAPALQKLWTLSPAESAWLTISIQLGFIAGTFLYAALNLADRFNARRVFAASAVLGAGLNAAFAWLAPSLVPALGLRFLAGVTLAGVYPVGMKIVASWFQSGLGWRLGIMVGALTFGTASPYFLRSFDLEWRWMVTASSFLAVAGAGLVLTAIPDGPYLKGRARFHPAEMFKVFGVRRFRLSALGYFGHMWELYAFWAFVSFFAGERFGPLMSFATVGIGAVGCAAGGWASRRIGEQKVALLSLLISAACCLASGLLHDAPAEAVAAFLIVWGFFVVSDSPQFSALSARYCPPEYTGTALTVQNGIGFLISVATLQLVPIAAESWGWPYAFLILAPGPLIGACFTWRLGRIEDRSSTESDR